jgi:hypothetical protein
MTQRMPELQVNTRSARNRLANDISVLSLDHSLQLLGSFLSLGLLVLVKGCQLFKALCHVLSAEYRLHRLFVVLFSIGPVPDAKIA